MIKLNSKSDKRLIVEGKVNDKTAYFLIDTGASLGIIDSNQYKEFKLKKGRYYTGTIVGAGGAIDNVYHCDTFLNIQDRHIPQFLIADISNVVESIEKQTNIKILGIISLPQMKMCNISIDCNDNEIILE